MLIAAIAAALVMIGIFVHLLRDTHTARPVSRLLHDIELPDTRQR